MISGGKIFRFYKALASAIFAFCILAPGSVSGQSAGTLLYDHFGVTLQLQAPHSGGSNYSFDWNSFVPTLNTGTANFVESDWYGDWNFSAFGSDANTIQHTPAPGTDDLDFYASGDEPYDVEAIYFDDDNTNLYVVVVTSFPHYVAANNDVGLVDPRISSDDVLVRSGDLSLNLYDGSPRVERNSTEWHYNYGVDIIHENRDDIITVGTYQTRGMRDNNLGNKLYKTGYDAGGSNILNPADSDWYTSLIDGVVESCWNHTNFDPFSTQSTQTLSYKGDVTTNYYEYDFGGGLQENGHPTYVYEFTIPRILLGDDDPCTNDPVGIRWVEGCRNDGNSTAECLKLIGSTDECNAPASIGDYVWYDANHDGIQNDGGAAVGLGNVKLTLFDGTNTAIDITYTDNDGWYEFTGLLADDYTVLLDNTTLPPVLVNATYDYDGIDSQHFAHVTLADGETNNQLDFGYSDQPLPVTLTSFKVNRSTEGVVITWITESEIENQGFVIERKENSNSEWKEIANHINNYELQGQGTVTYSTEYEYIDKLVYPGNTYEYRLGDIDYNGVVTYHATEMITIDLSDKIGTPEAFIVKPAYPNPFNPSTIIEYGLPETGQVNVAIYDILGHSIKTLVSKDQMAGWHSISWQGTDDKGSLVPAGLYIGVVITDKNKQTFKLMFVK